MRLANSQRSDGRFGFLDLPPGSYTLTIALSGFATIVRENVVVAVGKTVDLPLTMTIATLAESITVSGGSPIVDTKATCNATNFTADELTKIPTSRDPFALMSAGLLVIVRTPGAQSPTVHPTHSFALMHADL